MVPLSLLAALPEFLQNAGHWVVAGLGIGLVIFVHEAGHFLVAKRCGVRVEIFSLGFGPRLFGFRRGDTDYRVCLVPIGGYVKMAGDNPGENLEGDDTELPSKSVGQRFAIFSAGVVMNVAFALVTLPVVLALGVQFHSTVIGGVAAGGPAWDADLRAGDEVTRVDGHAVYDFNDVIAGIALGDARGVRLELLRDGAPLQRKVVPTYDESLGRYVIGVQPSLAETFEIEPEGPAARAGLTAQDVVVSFNGEPVTSISDFELRRQQNEGARVTLEVRDAEGALRSVTLEARPAPYETRLVGIQPFENQVRALRGAADGRADFLEVGDEVEALLLRPAQGEPQRIFPIYEHADLVKALEVAGAAPDMPYALAVRREGERVVVAVPGADGAELAGGVALGQNPRSCRVRLLDGYPAQAAGLPSGARIHKVNQTLVRSFQDIKAEIEEAAGPIVLHYEHGNRSSSVEVEPRVDRRLSDFGMLRYIATVERRFGMLEAAKVGIVEAGFMLKNVFLTLKKIFAREVSPKNLSGILTIGYVSKSLAESGLTSLFFFLAVLSLNLAFLNVLPIPVLDGGHLFFLLIEKIKGSPVSDRVMGYSQLVGLVLVLALLLYVTYQDLLKLFANLS